MRKVLLFCFILFFFVACNLNNTQSVMAIQEPGPETEALVTPAVEVIHVTPTETQVPQATSTEVLPAFVMSGLGTWQIEALTAVTKSAFVGSSCIVVGQKLVIDGYAEFVLTATGESIGERFPYDFQVTLEETAEDHIVIGGQVIEADGYLKFGIETSHGPLEIWAAQLQGFYPNACFEEVFGEWGNPNSQ